MSATRERLEHRIANDMWTEEIYRLKIARYLILNGVSELIPARLKDEAIKYKKEQ